MIVVNVLITIGKKTIGGECDEYCLINCDLSKSCKKSMLVRKFISTKLSIIDYYYEWKMKWLIERR